MYAKRQDVAARKTREDGGYMNKYTKRKTEVTKKVLRNAFIELEYVSDTEYQEYLGYKVHATRISETEQGVEIISKPVECVSRRPFIFDGVVPCFG
jgi:hypothetical protein